MRREISNKIEIPLDVKLEINNGEVVVKGPHGENRRHFKLTGITMTKKENDLVLECKKATKKEKKMINTTASHIRNMIKGVREKFEYKMKICFSHFPMTVEVKGNEATIKNFLGEKIPRHAKIISGIDVKVVKEFITITGTDKEKTGQTAANFEKASTVRNKDRRIFQDGIFITHKPEEEI